MGKNLIQQKRGKGSSTYRAPAFRYEGDIKYLPLSENITGGKITDIIHSSGHSGPLLKIKYDNGKDGHNIAPEGVRVNDMIQVGQAAEVKPGAIMSLKDIPEGTSIYNIEVIPGDGGKFCRASGASAKILSKIKNHVLVQLPSKKEKLFHFNCRASVGIVAGSGRVDKPFIKAGGRFYWKRARNKLYPKISGIAQNAVNHPFGGSRSSKKNKPSTVSRNAPPGRKVGLIAAKRTGRHKR
ncbi:MAG: 50S ribosomal protein L2 [Candidatus Woesearchaeota archaeon]|nr:50S ribosomal protein L2 [Candidatus Woesearchaeota archaeon]